jgi:hypothetical protein
MSKKMGIRLDGCEDEFERILRETARKFDEFNALEIGTAGGTTLRAMSEIILETKGAGNWRCIGTDLERGFNDNQAPLQQNFGNSLLVGDSSFIVPFRVPALIIGDAKEYIKKIDFPLHFVHQDSCHCLTHTKEDFLAVEPYIVKNGIILFHDACLISQGTDHQHNGHFIEVRQALVELGLLDNKRVGWEIVTEIKGTRTEENVWGGHGCAVFRKI